MERILTDYPKHFTDCASCQFAKEAHAAAMNVPQLPAAIRSEVDVSCVPPETRYNSTQAIVTADVRHVFPFPSGIREVTPYQHTVTCLVAVERLLKK